MKTHIALVGSQPIPVFLGIKSSGENVNRVILVHSSQTREEASRLAVCCSKMPSCEQILLDPVNLDAIETCARQLYDQVKDDEVVLDLTSGTKAWSLTFYRVFMTLEKARFILVNQNNLVVDLITHEETEETIDNELRFLLYGTPLKRFTPFSEYTEEDFKVCKRVEKLRLKNHKAFNELTKELQSEKNQGRRNSINGTFIEWDKEVGSVNLCLCNTQGEDLKPTYLLSPHALDIVFNNGWFELKTAMELSKNPMVKNIWMNCEFVAKGNMSKNEIDIILDMGNKLFFVECKTMVFEMTDIDKFHSAIKNFSGTSSKGIFVVNDLPSVKHKKYSTVQEKCKDNDILIFNFSQYKKDKPNNPNLLSLNEIINSNLNKINKR